MFIALATEKPAACRRFGQAPSTPNSTSFHHLLLLADAKTSESLLRILP
jgi:hypothetical protein